MLKMIRDSSFSAQHNAYNITFPTEIMNWYYDNDQDTIIVLWNERNEIFYVSQLIENYFNYSVSDLIGERWTTFLPHEQAEQIKKHFASENTKLHLQNISFLPEQSKSYMFNGIVDKVKIKEEIMYICKLRNVTYVNELKEILLDSEKLVLAGQLSAGLVHEIRNPLTSLRGFLQLVQAGVKQKEEYYKVMIGEIDKLEKITSELLQMSKPFKRNKKVESFQNLVYDVIFFMINQSIMSEIQYVIDM